jgi:hypothetical protein
MRPAPRSASRASPPGQPQGASEPLLAAVGLPLGAYHTDDPDAIGGSLVCSRGELFELSPGSYTVWIGGLSPRTRGQLREWSDSHEVLAGVADLVGELLDSGLLTRLPEPGDQSAAWLDAYRLCPQGAGIGSTAEAPAEYSIGDRLGQPLLAVDPILYYVWALSAAAASLGEAVRAAAAVLGATPSALVPAVYQGLPYLLVYRVAYLDRT